jgi:glycine cleavage system H protein
MDFPAELKYTEEHEWVLVEDGVATIGVSDFAQEQLGDIVFVELPEVGDTLEVGDSFGVVESVKAVSDVYAPVSGEVVEINEELPDEPEALNNSPYDAGWMIKIKLTDQAALEGLMDVAAYREFVEKD